MPVIPRKLRASVQAVEHALQRLCSNSSTHSSTHSSAPQVGLHEYASTKTHRLLENSDVTTHMKTSSITLFHITDTESEGDACSADRQKNALPDTEVLKLCLEIYCAPWCSMVICHEDMLQRYLLNWIEIYLAQFRDWCEKLKRLEGVFTPDMQSSILFFLDLHRQLLGCFEVTSKQIQYGQHDMITVARHARVIRSTIKSLDRFTVTARNREMCTVPYRPSKPWSNSVTGLSCCCL